MPMTSASLLVALALAALSALSAAAQRDAGKTLHLVPHADPTVVDPQFIGIHITRNFGYLVYATWQVSDDKLTYAFHLRNVRRAFRNSLRGLPDSSIPVLWNIEKQKL